MPEQDPRTNEPTNASQFSMNVTVFGPIRPSPDLHRQTQRSLKAHSSGRDFFTDITLHDNRNSPGMRVEYTVTAQSPQGAVRAGAVYGPSILLRRSKKMPGQKDYLPLNVR